MADAREDIDALIVRTREAHEVLKDIKAATRELKTVIQEAEEAKNGLASMIATAVNEGIEVAVDVGLQTYGAAIEAAIDDATAAVYRRFDTIMAILMGEVDGDPEAVENAARVVRKTLTTKKPELTPQESWQLDQMVEALDRRLGRIAETDTGVMPVIEVETDKKKRSNQ